MSDDRQLALAIGHLHDAVTALLDEDEPRVRNVRNRLVALYEELTDVIDPLDDSREEDSDVYTDE